MKINSLWATITTCVRNYYQNKYNGASLPSWDDLRVINAEMVAKIEAIHNLKYFPEYGDGPSILNMRREAVDVLMLFIGEIDLPKGTLCTRLSPGWDWHQFFYSICLRNDFDRAIVALENGQTVKGLNGTKWSLIK